MSEPPASSDFTSRTNSNNNARRIITNSSSLNRRADPPSDPPDSRRLLSTSEPNVRRNTGSSREISTPTARATITNSLPSPTSAKRPPIEPPPNATSFLAASKRVDAPATISASVSSALPTFKGQVSGGSILKIEGKKVMTSPPVLSDQVKKAMEEARQQQKLDNQESSFVAPTTSQSILTDKVSNRKTTKKYPSTKVPVIEQPPQQKKSGGSTDLNTKTKTYDTDEAKSVTLTESSTPTPKEELKTPAVNPKAEPAPTIPSQYQKKKAIVNVHSSPVLPSSQKKLEETWEFDTAPSNASDSSCCIIS